MKFGSSDIDKYFIGSDEAEKIYLGSDLVWEPSSGPGPTADNYTDVWAQGQRRYYVLPGGTNKNNPTTAWTYDWVDNTGWRGINQFSGGAGTFDTPAGEVTVPDKLGSQNTLVGWYNSARMTCNYIAMAADGSGGYARPIAPGWCIYTRDNRGLVGGRQRYVALEAQAGMWPESYGTLGLSAPFNGSSQNPMLFFGFDTYTIGDVQNWDLWDVSGLPDGTTYTPR